VLFELERKDTIVKEIADSDSLERNNRSSDGDEGLYPYVVAGKDDDALYTCLPFGFVNIFFLACTFSLVVCVHSSHNWSNFSFRFRSLPKRRSVPSARWPRSSDRTDRCPSGSVCAPTMISSGTPSAVTGVVPSWVCKCLEILL